MKMMSMALFIALVCAALGCSGDNTEETGINDGVTTQSGCNNDTECKGDRICVDGKCSDPSVRDDLIDRNKDGGAKEGDSETSGIEDNQPGEDVDSHDGGDRTSAGGGSGNAVAGNDTSNAGSAAGTDATCVSGIIEIEKQTLVATGTLLVLFDRSNSMAETWSSSTKYEVAGQALINALTPHADRLTVGGIFFPSPGSADDPASLCNPVDPTHWIPDGPGYCLDPNALGGLGSCETNPITSDDQIDFCTVAQFVDALPARWFLQGGMGMTPLQGALERADEALSTTSSVNVAVLVMTDGMPNCDTDMAVVQTQLENWLSDGIQTHLVVLPSSEEAITAFQTLAQESGIGEAIIPDDANALESSLSDIVSNLGGVALDNCTIQATSPLNESDKLHLVVTVGHVDYEVPQDLATGGFSIEWSSSAIRLEGSVCDDARSGRFNDIQLFRGCVNFPLMQ